MAVQQKDAEHDRKRYDGHVPSVEVHPPSGQVSGGSAPPAAPSMNAGVAAGNEPPVTAASPALPFLPAVHATRPHPPDIAPRSNADDNDAVRRAAAGDAEAFRSLFLRHRGDVARLVYRMLSAPSDLDDVVQEVFVQVFRSLKDFRGQSKFSTWLHRVTVNVVLMHRRSARSRPVLTEEAPSELVADDGQTLPDEDAERRERVRAFQRLLARLADKKRIVFVLHELEGLPPAEIADVVGAPVLTVRTRLFYARRELEAMLHEEPSLASLRATFAKDAKDAKSKGGGL